MTPPSAVAGRGGTTLPRRSAGPRRAAAPPRARTGAGSAARAPRRAPARPPAPSRAIRAVLDAPLLDRLVRGSGWIPLIAVGLLGIVFMQVSMLKLNAGIGRAVESAATLERQNAELRSQVSQLDGNERIEGIAREAGMVVPAAGSFRYVTARPGRTDAREAARNIAPPAPVAPGSTLTGQEAAATQTAPPATAPPATAPPATVPPATTPPAAAAPPATAPPATAAPTGSPPATAPPAAAAGGTSAPPATAAPGAGG